MNRTVIHTRVRAFFLFALLATFVAIAHSCATIDYRVELTDATLAQGSATYFRLTGARSIENTPAVFTGGTVTLARTPDGTAMGLIATDIETTPGTHELTIGEGRHARTIPIEVTEGEFKTQRLSLPRKMVDLDADTLERVRREADELSLVWLTSAPKPLWDGPFAMPTEGPVTSNFGMRRILNGNPRGYHGGVDIAAPKGAPVHAAAGGQVAFTGDFYFYGRFVVIDHGLGVFTLYSHLSKVSVAAGDAVDGETVIGEVGMTGRATGPHLHFAVKVGLSRVSPERLYKVVRELDSLMRPRKAQAGETGG